jgi:hypothetical protein
MTRLWSKMVTGSSVVTGSSDYEELRQRNIERNNAILSALAIDSSANTIEQTTSQKDSRKAVSEKQ